MPADSVSRSDSNGSSNESQVPENILGTSPGVSSLRERTDSESSDRVNTRFILPSMDGSPPKVLTLNEVRHVVSNIQNMELAHEIALNPEFKLQPYEPPENSLERRIKDILHKAFWDLLREQLEQQPPCYDHAIQLLADIKECFPQILTLNNERILSHINEVLDPVVIRQQAERGTLDFKSYANFVIQIMAQSCAPARDDDVKKLSETEDAVDTFRGILETMTLMKLDMANYMLDHARNHILSNSVEYEKKKFKEYLDYYKFGFPATEDWLKRNCINDANNDVTIMNAYMELMEWPESKEFPEVLNMDKERILKLGRRARRLCVWGSLNSLCMVLPIISQRSENRTALAKQIQVLLQDVNSESDIAEAIENIWEQIKAVINGYLQNEQQAVMDETVESMLKTQVLQIGSRDSPVRALLWKRLQIYVRLYFISTAGLPPPPPGYVDCSEELEAFSIAFKRVINYNNSVFGDYFGEILNKLRSEPIAAGASTSAAAAATRPAADAVEEKANTTVETEAKQ